MSVDLLLHVRLDAGSERQADLYALDLATCFDEPFDDAPAVAGVVTVPGLLLNLTAERRGIALFISLGADRERAVALRYVALARVSEMLPAAQVLSVTTLNDTASERMLAVRDLMRDV